MDYFEELALLKFRLIAPVLNATEPNQAKYFRKVAAEAHRLPSGEGVLHFKPQTLKKWLRKYRQKGFPGLQHHPRKDLGVPRAIDEEQQEQIREVLRTYSFRTVRGLYEFLLDQGVLAREGCTYATLNTFVRSKELFEPASDGIERKAFTKPFVNMLWVGDLMYGPHVAGPRRGQRTYLFALLDDHSRFPVGSTFDVDQGEAFIERVLTQALLAYGVPNKLYFDNGKVFGRHLELAGARLGYTVVHSKPGDPAPRGKIERFFRTVRDRFLDRYLKTLGGKLPTLESLQEAYRQWLQDDYLHKVHTTLGEAPHAHYFAGLKAVTIRKKTPEEVREAFRRLLTRKVSRDALVSLGHKNYEVPGQYIGKTVHIQCESGENDTYFLLQPPPLEPLRLKPVDRYGNSGSALRFA